MLLSSGVCNTAMTLMHFVGKFIGKVTGTGLFPPCGNHFPQKGRNADNYGYPRIVYSLEILEIARIQETKKYHDTYNARGTFQMGDYSVSSRLVSNLFDGFT